MIEFVNSSPTLNDGVFANSIKAIMLNSEFASMEETILEVDEVASEEEEEEDEVVDDLEEDEDDEEEDDETTL